MFWRMGFYPTYRRDEVHQALDVVCRRHAIKGRVVYEVFGQHDLIARFWILRSVAAADVDRDIKRTLNAFHLEYCDMFEVDSIGMHWFWDEEPTPASPPSESVLASPPSAATLHEVDALAAELNSGRLSEDTFRQNAHATDFLNKGVIGIRETTDGIKFAIIVSTSTELSTRFTMMEALGNQLRRIMTGADLIRERSLYSGTGFGKFLILGKVEPNDFFSINNALIGPIVDEAYLAGVYRTRSITYVGNSATLMTFGESLSLPAVMADEDDDYEITEILSGGENARVEYKASGFVDLNRWLATGERVEENAFESLAHAVVALLNAEGGGVIVLGVVEQGIRDYRNQLADLPTTDGLMLLGIAFDWESWKRKEFDEYRHRLQQKLAEAIEPSPMDLVRYSRETVEGRELCVLTVSGLSPEWHYLKTGPKRFDFVVREDAQSVALSGPAEDRYKQLHPRS